MPNRLSLTSTPFSMKMLSNAKAPLIDHLAGVGRVLVQAGRQRRDPLQRARRRQRLDFLVLDVQADHRIGQRFGRGGDVHLLLHTRCAQRDVVLRGASERHDGLSLDGLEVGQAVSDLVSSCGGAA